MFQVVYSVCWWFGHWQSSVDYIPLDQITNFHCAVINVNPFSRGINKQTSHSLLIVHVRLNLFDCLSQM